MDKTTEESEALKKAALELSDFLCLLPVQARERVMEELRECSRMKRDGEVSLDELLVYMAPENILTKDEMEYVKTAVNTPTPSIMGRPIQS